jgi:hypothetical protein
LSIENGNRRPQQRAEKLLALIVLKGRGFSRAAKSENMSALQRLRYAFCAQQAIKEAVHTQQDYP